MVHLDQFPVGTYHKLWAPKIRPCQIIHKVNNNDDAVELPNDLQISNTFNVANLKWI